MKARLGEPLITKLVHRLLGSSKKQQHVEKPPQQDQVEELRTYLAKRFIQGQGLEIGALHKPLWVPIGADVKYVDRMDVPGLRQHYPELEKLELVNVDIIDDGESLNTIQASSQDFIIANHFLEHTQDPIGTIQRHLELLKPGGILYLAVPDKRWTFDVKRPVTPLEHLYRDYNEGPAWSYMQHVREFSELVDNLTGPALEAHVAKIIEIGYSIHFHVWTQRELLEMFISIRQKLDLPFDIQAVLSNPERAETINILQRI